MSPTYGDVGPIECLTLLSVQRVHIFSVLARCDWDKVRAARCLGIGHRTLYYWVDDLRAAGYDIPLGVGKHVAKHLKGQRRDRRSPGPAAPALAVAR